jgi:hypothetical protein
LLGAAKKVTEAERDRGRDGWGRVDEAMEPRAGRPLGRWIALALAALLLAFLLILWLGRKDIAAGYIDRELARRGVRATYTVRHLGFGTQRLDNLVLGDPAHPDLTARWVEIHLSWGFRKPRVSLVTARGVRLYGRVEGGRLRFGELDKLLPKPSGAPFRLPDQNVDLADAAIRIDTPGGRIGAALEGKGNLASGFEGRVAVSAPRLRLGGCEMVAGAALWNVATETLQPSVAGPARFESLACGGNLLIRRAEARLGATLSASLTAWRGEARLTLADAQAGLHHIDSVAGNLSFAGGLRDTRGHADLAAAQVHTSGFAAGRTRVNGVYSLSLKNGRLVTAVTARAAAVAAPPSLASPILSALASARGTPVEPVAEAWRRAVSGALRRFDATADIRLAVEGSRGGVRCVARRRAARPHRRELHLARRRPRAGRHTRNGRRRPARRPLRASPSLAARAARGKGTDRALRGRGGASGAGRHPVHRRRRRHADRDGGDNGRPLPGRPGAGTRAAGKRPHRR